MARKFATRRFRRAWTTGESAEAEVCATERAHGVRGDPYRQAKRTAVRMESGDEIGAANEQAEQQMARSGRGLVVGWGDFWRLKW